MDDKVLLRLDSLLRHIELVLKDTKGINILNLDEDSLLYRATCFSISQIGEKMVQLEKKIGDKYPDLPWMYSRTMRNFIVHDYDNVDKKMVSSTVTIDLPLLKESFLEIRKDYEKKTV